MAEDRAEDESGPAKARKTFGEVAMGMKPREVALVVGIAAVVTATAASTTSPLAGLVASAVLTGLTFWLPHGRPEDEGDL